MTDLERLQMALRAHWLNQRSDDKVTRYLDQFFERRCVGSQIVARVEGNHGTYTVSAELVGEHVRAACDCYIGQAGDCHHCAALVQTFLRAPETFRVVTPKTFDDVHTLADLPDYLAYITLAELVERLKEAGITQKAFAEAIGSTSSMITGLKASEADNQLRSELGAVKLAALWVLETFAGG